MSIAKRHSQPSSALSERYVTDKWGWGGVYHCDGVQSCVVWNYRFAERKLKALGITVGSTQPAKS